MVVSRIKVERLTVDRLERDGAVCTVDRATRVRMESIQRSRSLEQHLCRVWLVITRDDCSLSRLALSISQACHSDVRDQIRKVGYRASCESSQVPYDCPQVYIFRDFCPPAARPERDDQLMEI